MASCTKPNPITPSATIETGTRGSAHLHAKARTANEIKCALRCRSPPNACPADGVTLATSRAIVNAIAQKRETRRRKSVIRCVARGCRSARLQVVVVVLCDPKARPALAQHKRRRPAKPARSTSSTTPRRTPILRLKTKSLCEPPSDKRVRSLLASQKGLHILNRYPAGAGWLRRIRPPAYKKASSRHIRPSANRSTRGQSQ